MYLSVAATATTLHYHIATQTHCRPHCYMSYPPPTHLKCTISCPYETGGVLVTQTVGRPHGESLCLLCSCCQPQVTKGAKPGNVSAGMQH